MTPPTSPPVSVVIAAYNEAKVINKTIATLLASDYPELDIIVVDDGSKDDTAGVVTAAYGSHPRVTVITKPNGGKASALNLGIKRCRRRDHRRAGRRHRLRPGYGLQTGPPLRRSGHRRGFRQRQSRQPQQPADHLAGRGVYHQPELRPAGVRPAELYHGRPRRGRRVAQGRR